MGVQSRPEFLMCINGEEITTGRSGVYELKNGLVQTVFFYVVTGAEENNNVVSQSMETMNAQWASTNQITDVEQRTAVRAAIGSKCFFNNPKTRSIDSFTLDYMYREE